MYRIIDKFINWPCHKFCIGESKELIKEFESDTNTCIDPEIQLKNEEYKKDWYFEL